MSQSQTEDQPRTKARKKGQVNRQVVRVALGEIGPDGDPVAQVEGEAVPIFGGIPGEEVEAEVLSFRRRRHRRTVGRVLRVLKASPHRIAPPCPYYGECTGCPWQHIDYDHQLDLKRARVARHLGEYPSLAGVSVAPTVPSPQRFHYRNHARFTVRRREGELGFVNRLTRRWVKIDHCLLMAPWINEALAALQGRCHETTQLSIRYGINTGDWLIQPALLDPAVPLDTGQKHYTERLLGRTFRVASPSFFQVNTAQAEAMVGLVRERLGLTGSETLVDAYAGVGTFGLLLAPHARRVILIEESPAAVQDATFNAQGLDNVVFRQGKAEEVLLTLEERPDAVVVDPPRAGCHPAALAALASVRPRRMVYVSCSPDTLARDLDILARSGFRVIDVTPVDMFPQTHHVECLATLEPCQA